MMKRAIRISVLLGTVWAGLACQGYPFVFQPKGTIGVTRKDVTIDVPSQSDILFVIDNSGSMQPKIARLEDQVKEFTAALFATGNKFRIGITTIDQQDPATGSGTPNCDNPPNPTPGADPLFNGVCGHLLAPAGSAGFLDSANFTTSDEMGNAVKAYLAHLNPNGSSWEQPVKAAWAALDPANRAPGKADAGFFRDDALLVILILTDESDCSFEPGSSATFIDPSIGAGDACYAKASQLVPGTEWASRITTRKGGDPRNVAVGVISGAYFNAAGGIQPGDCYNVPGGTPDVAAECFGFIADPFFNSYSPNGHVGDAPCFAVGNNRLFDFSSQFASVRDSICRTDYSKAMLQLANLADRQCFPLDAPPINNDTSNISISLERAGEVLFQDVPFTTDASGVTSGWNYSADPTPQVCLQGTWKRKKGDTIRLYVLDTQTGDTSTPAR